MTDDELRKLAEAALADDKAATPGPWGKEKVRCGGGIDLHRVTYRPQDDLNLGATFQIADLVTTQGGLAQQGRDAAFIAAARTREPELACAVLRLMQEHDTWKDNAETWLDQEMTSPQIWRMQKALIEAARNVVKDSGDLRELEGPVRDLEEAERTT